MRPIDVHLNLNVRGLKPSATLAINERCEQMRQEGRDVFKLGLGQSPFPVPDPVVEELRVNAYRKDYLQVTGLRELRAAVAEYHHRKDGLNCNADDVLIGPGSKELMFLLQLVYYGNLVIPTPSWVSYAPQAHIIGRHVVWLSTSAKEDWKLAPQQLAELCAQDSGRPRIAILNYPSNPTGATFSDDELREIAEVARSHGLILLSDEIYGELHHEGQHVSIARFFPEGTIVSSGLSKWCGAGGWRLGTFTFPSGLRWLREGMSIVASETYTATSAPIQYAAVRAFQGGMEIERYLSQSRRILKALGNWISDRLRGADVHVALPQGAFYLFPEFESYRDGLQQRGIKTSAQLCDAMLEATGVAMLPGSDFGRPANELSARLAYVDFDGARALAAAEFQPHESPIDEKFLHTHCGRILEAINRVVKWLRDEA